ncbi:MAG: universal stress protein [Nitrosopumilus sp.]|nr:universal stress protein [Nitrosopumilus sp.]
MIKSILVPYDGSKYSKKAIFYAKEMASKFDATMYLLTVIDEHEYLHGVLLAELEDDYTVKDTVQKFIKSEVIIAKKITSKLAKNYEKEKIGVHHHAMKGNPDEAILDYAKANNIDLIF